MSSEEEILKAGVSALRSGDRKQASAILAKLVQEYPRSERGWYLLGMSVSSPEQRTYCFKRVLDINPNNPDAGKQLGLPSKPASTPPPPAWAYQPPPAQTSRTYSPPEPIEPEPSAQQKAPPFVYSGPKPEYEFEDSQNNSPDFLSQSKAKEQDKKPGEKAKKKTNWVIVSSIIAGVVILVCTVSIGAMYLLGTLGDLTSSFQLGQSPTQTIVPLYAAAPTATQPPVVFLPTAMPTVAYTPTFEEVPCQFDALGNVNVTCGYAIVPEDRTGDPSQTIRLAVAVFHSKNSNPAPDPVIFLQGGPGGEAIGLSANAYPVLVEPFLSNRDFIAYDQRGTGLSEPALVCEELERVNFQDIYGSIDASARELVYQNAFLSCGGLLQSRGINLSAYNTVENAADLRDIVKLLGYEKVNLYGASYGTRLALVTMRNHPEIVRSAILDSVMPVETNWLTEFPNISEYTLTTLFTACKADPDCNKAYPDIETVFWELVQELDTNPVTLTTSTYPTGTVTETIDGYYLLSVVMGLIKTTPQTIYRLKTGDYSTLIAAQHFLPYAFEGINPGLYISVMCREHVLDTTPELLQATTEQIHVENFIWRPFYENLEKMASACKSWDPDGPVLGEKDATISEIPSLVITGTFDTATPPSLGKQAAGNLANSFYFEFTNQGHVPTLSDTSGCAMQVALDFLENPQAEPNRDCMSQLSPVEFLVPYTGEPAVEMDTVQYDGIRVDVPTDWEKVDDGFLWRGSSQFDITQINILRIGFSVQDLVDYFSSSINGYHGFDAAPAPAGTRQANGRTWTLYYTTSNDRPVDIAATEDGGSSLIIVMFSHPDEHDALYRTVFLPAVDSAR